MRTQDGARPRILIVEDVALLLYELEETLSAEGFIIAGRATTLREGLALALALDIDAAVLDFDLNGHEAGPMADVLSDRGIPFLLATARSPWQLPLAYQRRPHHSKPYLTDQLAKQLRALAGSRVARGAAAGAVRAAAESHTNALQAACKPAG